MAISSLLDAVNHKGTDKIKQYKWKHRGDVVGQLAYIPKGELNVNRDVYQRIANTAKVLSIARDWSWVSCGAISVAERDGEFWVFDGGHRKAAADRRSDIYELPCIVHHVETVEKEAQAFLDTNTLRKPVSALDKFRASLVANDPTALLVKAVLDESGLRLASASKEPRDFKSVRLAQKLALTNPEAFRDVFALVGEMALSEGRPVHEKLVGGLYYIHTHIDGGINELRLRNRIKQVGMTVLLQAANKASAYYARGGDRVWADGMLQAINKGLQKRFDFSE